MGLLINAENRIKIFQEFAENYPDLLARDNIAIVSMTNAMNATLKELEKFASDNNLVIPPKDINLSHHEQSKATVLAVLGFTTKTFSFFAFCDNHL